MTLFEGGGGNAGAQIRLIYFIGGDELKVRDRLAVMQRVVADDETQVEREEAAIVGFAVPLAVHTEDHVPAIPQGSAQMDLLAGVHAGGFAMWRDVAPEAEGNGVVPGVEIP